MIGRIRRWYGAHPLHLLALLAAFALAGYAAGAVVAAGKWKVVALWFLVAIVGHDLLLFPLYSLADLSVRRLLPPRPGGAPAAPSRAASPPNGHKPGSDPPSSVAKDAAKGGPTSKPTSTQDT